ncbi:pentapeptide repeat-containing protein [Psychroserpens sp. AS72]|uniref:pentapeptide repeat-containing protein n=1 Tax=Psychroserpens sp. AS72 TaxID=3135775 RepID=UPI00317110F9
MKHYVLVLVALVQMSCATQNSSANEDTSMKNLIRNSQPVYIENQTINDVIDFTSFLDSHLISEGVYQVEVNAGITFKKCIFTKPVSAITTMENGSVVLTSFKGNVTFIDCIFKENVNFRGSSIQGRVDFTSSTFNKDANFEELNCHENTFFNKCVFEGSVRFQNAFFNQKANFMNAEFFDNVSFQSSVFNSELQCSASKFYKYADFTLVDCRGKALFNYAEFRTTADFSHSKYFQDFDFISTKNNTTSFDSCRFLGLARFNKIEVSSAMSFKDSYFLLTTPEIDLPTEKLMNLK